MTSADEADFKMLTKGHIMSISVPELGSGCTTAGGQFDNDGSIGSILLKNVKRAMAGEYSRELSVKVFAGQCRLIEHGFRQGGPAGYGLRRLLVDESRAPKGELSIGDRKSLQTDRVVLTLGPSTEIEQVSRIYSLFVHAMLWNAKNRAVLKTPRRMRLPQQSHCEIDACALAVCV